MKLQVKKVGVPENIRNYIWFLQYHHYGLKTLEKIWNYKSPFDGEPSPLKKYLEKVKG